MSSSFTSAPRSRLWWVAGQAWSAFRAFQLRRQCRNAGHILERLDDTMLKDMGIARGHIPGVVYEATAGRGAGGEDLLG
jgi:uncharacterized protein YjiS (DUF1127 family)